MCVIVLIYDLRLFREVDWTVWRRRRSGETAGIVNDRNSNISSSNSSKQSGVQVEERASTEESAEETHASGKGMSGGHFLSLLSSGSLGNCGDGSSSDGG